jgi:beta-phosphoglucomutase-like phosphatase (HAD superfamily)
MKAVIFDFDGTILDTEYTEFAAWQFIYSEYNSILPIDRWQKRLHSNPEIFDPMLYLENVTGITLDRERVTKRRREKLAELVVDLKPLPGINNWIFGVKAKSRSLSNHFEKISDYSKRGNSNRGFSGWSICCIIGGGSVYCCAQ